MKDFIKNNYIYLIIILGIIIVMTFFMSKKEGFHEDEVFSYGSSSYFYDNVFRRYGRSDATNTFMEEKILDKDFIKTLKNIKYYFIEHNDEFKKYVKDFDDEKHPVWRTRSEANDYITLQPKEALNYFIVYYNQSRDVHPPLFYFLVHTVSILFLNNFSKYIVFIVNIIFIVASLWTIKKIFVILDKKHLIISGLIFYGLSMGAISTVVFLRMYTMLTFFGLYFIYLNIKIAKNDFCIEKNDWIILGVIIVLGFLTQYYFCVLAVLIAGMMFIKICQKKDKKQILKYIFNYIKIALIGVILFPASIYHIFFSYRGVGEAVMKKSFLEKILDYFSLIGYSYSVPFFALVLVIVLGAIFILVKRLKCKEKISKLTFNVMLALMISLVCYVLLIVKLSPELEYSHTLRYIMPILPIMMIVVLIVVDSCFNNKKISSGVILGLVSAISIYGLFTSEVSFLYKGYNKYLDIAEKNKDLKFVYVGDCGFCHMQSMQEFATYSESLILYDTELEYLINDEKIKSEDEFILSIKKYKGDEKILNRIVDETDFKNYELLLDDDGEVGCVIYRMKR